MACSEGENPASSSTQPEPEWLAIGAEIYQESCLLYHGRGEPTALVPALRHASTLQDPEKTAQISLFGLAGQSSPDAIMPGAPDLSNEELTGLIHYLRWTFLQQASDFDPSDAAQARAKGAFHP